MYSRTHHSGESLHAFQEERRIRRRKFLSRYWWLLLLLIPSAWYACLQFPLYQVKRELYARNLLAAPVEMQMPSPMAGERILILAPHEDDEALACGGYIQQAVAAGARVHVVLMTNGDYSGRMGLRSMLRPQREDYIQLGYRRQQETLAALRRLGLSQQEVTFLGYPNGPLYRMWQTAHWLPADAAESARTHCTSSPYTNAFTANTVHCGQSVVDDLVRLIARESPDIIITPHAQETNADHWSTACYADFALNELRAQKVPFARTCRRYAYLIHWPQWPAPLGFAPDEMLNPPMDLHTPAQTRWRSFMLTKEQVQYKKIAIDGYASQGGSYLPLLQSFIKRNELFDECLSLVWPPAQSVPLTTMLVDAESETEKAALNPSGDIVKVELGRKGGRLLVRVQVKGDTTPQMRCHLSIHAGGASSACRLLREYAWQAESASGTAITRGEKSSMHPAALSTRVQGKYLELQAPWPFAGVGEERRQFFLVRAWITEKEDIVDQTATGNVLLVQH